MHRVGRSLVWMFFVLLGWGSAVWGNQAGFDAVPALAFTGEFKAVPASGVAPLYLTFYTLVGEGTAPFTYAYDFGDGTYVSTAVETQTHTYSQAGTYTAKVQVTDAVGLCQEFTAEVTVSDTLDLDIYENGLVTNADDMDQVTDIADMKDIITDAVQNISQALDAVENAGQVQKEATQAAIRQKAGLVIQSTKMKFESFIAAGQADETAARDILEGVADMVAALVTKGVPITEDSLEAARAVSSGAYGLLIEKVVEQQNLTPDQIQDLKTDKAKAKDFFAQTPHLMADAVQATGVGIETPADLDVADVKLAAAKHNLTQNQVALLYGTILPTLDAGNAVVKASLKEPEQSIADVAHAMFEVYYPGKSLSSSVMDPVTRQILFNFDDGSAVSALVKRVSIVDDYFPQGLHEMPDGSLLGVVADFALAFSPYPVFPLDLNADLILLDTAPGLDTDGFLTLAFDQGWLAAKSGWAYQDANAFSGATTSYSVTGGSDPSAEAYAILVTYDTGSAQALPPAVLARDDLFMILDDFFWGGYAVDPDTGVIDLQTVQFKPDYLFTPLTAIDYTAITAAGGMEYQSMAFETGDFNNDGLYDLKFYSLNPMGQQVLYTLPD